MSFSAYVTRDDRTVIDTCLSEDCDPNDEEILEFLSMWKCCRVPTKENIEAIMFELAHQELATIRCTLLVTNIDDATG